MLTEVFILRFNLMRPILIIAVALFAKSIVTTISLLAGASEETASNIGFIAMIIAALIAFQRLNRNKHNRNGN